MGHELSRAVVATCLFLLSAPSSAQEDLPGTQPANRTYSPYPEQVFPNQVFFGDTHLHTTYSADAGMVGNSLGPDQAYRFAKGEVVTSSTGVEARLSRPLDSLSSPIMQKISASRHCSRQRTKRYYRRNSGSNSTPRWRPATRQAPGRYGARPSRPARMPWLTILKFT